FSIGLFLKDNGTVVDVILNSPATKAGFAPGMLVVAVNGRKFSGDIFKQAIMESKNSPLDFIVENAEYYNVLHVDYHEGPKFPHLERVPGKAAVFDDIIKPLAH
ncbi:MAG TPA: M61 family peptidase, partial [Terriglobales bacterium]